MVRRVALSDSERLSAKSGVASPNLLRAAQNAVTEGSDCALQHVAGAAHNFRMGEAWKDRFLGEFQCAQCGALYEVAITRLSAPVYDEVICEVCRRVMNGRRGTVGRAYTLKASGWWHSFRPLRLRFRGKRACLFGTVGWKC
jgi:hypothetical protein